MVSVDSLLSLSHSAHGSKHWWTVVSLACHSVVIGLKTLSKSSIRRALNTSKIRIVDQFCKVSSGHVVQHVWTRF